MAALIRRIDPFSEPYASLAAKKPREHYLEVYRRIFRELPEETRRLALEQWRNYVATWAEAALDPANLVDPWRAVANGARLWAVGLGLARGFLNYWHDERVKWGLREPDLHWRLGRNIGTTPRETVYSSPILDVYRYLPTGPVRPVPFLMYYSWINAYWILDLTPEVSHMRHLRDLGVDVYITNWKVPEDEAWLHADLATYLAEAKAAAERVLELTGQEKLAIGGYCIGGVVADLVASLLADRLVALVNLTTALDTMAGEEGAGAFGAFTNFEIARLDEYLARHGGTFPKKAFEEFFDDVKPKRAVRNFFQRYVYGATDPMDPVTYWNRKSAKPIVPAHAEFLRRFYNDNELASGRVRIGDWDIDLGRIRVPALIVMAEFDHIVPLPCALRTAHLIGTPAQDQKNVLVRGGHVRAIVNQALLPVISDFLLPHLGDRQVSRPAFGLRDVPLAA